jgi:hypothetical protein
MVPGRNGRKVARDLAIGIALAVLVLLCPLVVAGHLPPRGLVSGTVYNHDASGKSLRAPGPRLVFQQAGSGIEFVAAVDAMGRYSATLPPGKYHIVSKAGYAAWQVPGLHPDPVSGDAVLAYLELVQRQGWQETGGVSIVAGEHVTVDVAFFTP